MDLAFAGIARIRTASPHKSNVLCEFCNATTAAYEVRLTDAEIDTEGYQQAKHCEALLGKYGVTTCAVGKRSKADAEKTYRVMLEVIKYRKTILADEEERTGKVRLLDVGCGPSFLYEYMLNSGIENVEYTGLDISEKFIHLAKSRFPSNIYYCLDILDEGAEIPHFDYVVMNSIFTQKLGLSFEEMFSYFKKVVRRAFNYADRGIAFNAMSKQVDWEREDLFHLPIDILAGFLTKELTRKFVIRNDYGLFEYTTYVYK